MPQPKGAILGTGDVLVNRCAVVYLVHLIEATEAD